MKQETGRSNLPPHGSAATLGPGRGGGRLREIIDKFRQKGATSSDKAMTAEELGMPPMFKEAMRRRLGQTGIFVETDGKYYLDESRLMEMREQRAKGRGLRL